VVSVGSVGVPGGISGRFRAFPGLLPGFRGFSAGVSVGGCQPVRDLDRDLLAFGW